MLHFLELFRNSVTNYHDKIAISFPQNNITYQELDRRSDALAKYLVNSGINSEEIIPLIIERSPNIIVAMIAVLKAGGAFLPISPITPCTRIKYLFEDTRAKIVLSTINIEHLTNVEMKVIDPDTPFREDIALPSSRAKHQLSYVMYTSGSTGNPKGVLIEQYSMMNLFLSLISKLNITHDDMFLALTDYTFDISLIELLMPLLCGASIILTEQGTVVDGIKIKSYLKNYPITCMQATPLSWKVLLKQGWKNEGKIKILVGGEQFPTKLAEQLNYRIGNIWNVYGPTETSMWSMANNIKNLLVTKSVPLGFPLGNTVIRVLDEELQPVKEGQQGELYIGGAGLARGYLNNIELTREKFICHPLTKEKLYKTGDLVFVHDKKTICYIERIDNQLKYGGIRIEAAEIEAAIEQEPFVKKAVIKIHENEGFYKSLAAYVEIDEAKVFVQDIFSVACSTTHFLKNIYDETYVNAQRYEHGHINNCGWQSSFNGRLFSVSELDESYQFVRKIIHSSNLQSVLEVGCGTGSLLMEYVNKAVKCVVVEISQKAIDYVCSKLNTDQQKKILFKNDSIQNIHRHQQYTCVIANSVVQYLPSINVLITTLTRLVGATKANGTIIIGDIRSLELLDLYYLEKIRIKNIEKSNIESELGTFYYKSHDSEIALSPRFFFGLKKIIKGISHIDINVKHGAHKNELNYFRYDVVIHVGKAVLYQTPLEWEFESLIKKRSWLNVIQSNSIPIIIRRIPNFYIEELLTKIDNEIPTHPLLGSNRLKLIDQKTKNKAQKLLELNLDDSEKFFSYCHSGHLNSLDMYIYPTNSKRLIRYFDPYEYDDYRSYCKEPFNPWIQQFCFEHIKLKVKQNLLSWVNPSVYIWIEKWPVTINGKLDKKKLCLPIKTNWPEEAEENTLSKLLTIWRNITGDQALVDTNFWMQGVSSLCMYFFLATINETFQININYHEFHNYNTLEKVSNHINTLLNLN